MPWSKDAPPTNPRHDPNEPHPDPRVHGPRFCKHRCGSCPSGEHHWIDAGDDPDGEPDDPDWAEADVRAWDRAHGTEHTMAYLTCRHCRAWAEHEFIDNEE